MNTNDTPQDLSPGDVTPTQPDPSVSSGGTPAAPASATSTAPASAAPADPADPQAAQKPRSRGRAGLIAGSIVGGVLVIALAFGGGTALGWALGTQNGEPTMSQEGPGFGPGDRDGRPGGPGQQQEHEQEQRPQDQRQQPRDRQDPRDGGQDGQEGSDSADPTPAPTT